MRHQWDFRKELPRLSPHLAQFSADEKHLLKRTELFEESRHMYEMPEEALEENASASA